MSRKKRKRSRIIKNELLLAKARKEMNEKGMVNKGTIDWLIDEAKKERVTLATGTRARRP